MRSVFHPGTSGAGCRDRHWERDTVLFLFQNDRWQGSCDLRGWKQKLFRGHRATIWATRCRLPDQLADAPAWRRKPVQSITASSPPKLRTAHRARAEDHTYVLQSHRDLVSRLLL